METRKSQTKLKEARHYFFLNPYIDSSFTDCPKCESETKIRKYCLVVHIEPRNLFLLNKSCRYCPACDLIIVKKADLEKLLIDICKQNAPDIAGNEYFVFGTIDKKDWRNVRKRNIIPQDAIKLLYPFKDIWKFGTKPSEWYPKKTGKALYQVPELNKRKYYD